MQHKNSFLKTLFFSLVILPISLVKSQCGCQSNACNMNTQYRGTNYVNGTNEIGVTLPDNQDGLSECQQICRWIEDCENFSWKEGQCRLIKIGEVSENSDNIHQLVRVSYDIGSVYGKFDCDRNCGCAARACNNDRSFSIDRYNRRKLLKFFICVKAES